VKKDYSQSVLRPTDDLGDADLRALFQPLIARAEQDMAGEGFSGESVVIDCAVDVRYIGQSYEIMVPLTPQYREEFDRRHARLYGYSNPHRSTEVVNLRVAAVALSTKPQLPRMTREQTMRATPCGQRDCVFAGRSYRAAVYRHDDLVPGAGGDGPALVVSQAATTVIPPRFRFEADEAGNVIICARSARRSGRASMGHSREVRSG
jgi:N-methylhydantoinase A/oxoprolinase/acetone carboxylase beta subunit